jgi:hypothetical protein
LQKCALYTIGSDTENYELYWRQRARVKEDRIHKLIKRHKATNNTSGIGGGDGGRGKCIQIY